MPLIRTRFLHFAFLFGIAIGLCGCSVPVYPAPMLSGLTLYVLGLMGAASILQSVIGSRNLVLATSAILALVVAGLILQLPEFIRPDSQHPISRLIGKARSKDADAKPVAFIICIAAAL